MPVRNSPARSPSGIARGLGPLAPLYVLYGIVALGWARIRLRTITPTMIQQANRHAAQGPYTVDEVALSAPTIIDVVARVVPWLGRKVPWRADCLVQALAAQAWLARCHIPSRIEIGVERSPDNGEFASHAWLRASGRIVTGGAIDRYTPMIGVGAQETVAGPQDDSALQHTATPTDP